MSKTKHTPGPWFSKYLPQHRARVHTNNGTTICDIALWSTDYAEQLENGRLIAAAPDMRAALGVARAALSQHLNEADPALVEAFDRVSDAIAKADGVS